MRSHQAVADFAVIAELPNDYLLIEFPRVGRDRPVLGLCLGNNPSLDVRSHEVFSGSSEGANWCLVVEA